MPTQLDEPRGWRHRDSGPGHASAPGWELHDHEGNVYGGVTDDLIRRDPQKAADILIRDQGTVPPPLRAYVSDPAAISAIIGRYRALERKCQDAAWRAHQDWLAAERELIAVMEVTDDWEIRAREARREVSGDVPGLSAPSGHRR